MIQTQVGEEHLSFSVKFVRSDHSGVIKRAILCHAQLYKVTLRWIAGIKGIVDEKTRIIWNTVVTMKVSCDVFVETIQTFI